VRYASSKKLCFFVRFASKKRRFFDNPTVLKKANRAEAKKGRAGCTSFFLSFGKLKPTLP
jgi:hypothetical protein